MKSMTRFVLLLCCLALLLPAHGAAADGPDLSRLDLGSHVMGPGLSKRDLKGRVVVVEYWGITCPPCIRSIPHVTELAKEHGHDKLVVIANQVWSASDRQTKERWQAHAKNNSVVVTNGGKLPGFDPSGVPAAVMFDHEGKVIWQGHPGSIDRALATAVANVPDRVKVQAPSDKPIVTDIQAKFFARDIKRINEQKSNLTGTLKRLRSYVDRSDRQEQVDEARQVLAAVKAWAQTQYTAAQAALESDPGKALALATHGSMLLDRDELGKPLTDLKQKIESDKPLMETIRSSRLLQEVVAKAEAIGLTKDPAAAKQARNASAARLIARDLRRIVRTYPETEAGKQAQQLLTDWGLTE